MIYQIQLLIALSSNLNQKIHLKIDKDNHIIIEHIANINNAIVCIIPYFDLNFKTAEAVPHLLTALDSSLAVNKDDF